MEKLQGSINPYLLQEELGMGCCLEEENGGLYISQFLSNTQDFEQGNEAHESLLPSLEDKMPFLQMLQGVESHHHHHQQQQIQNPFFPLMQEPNFQLLLKLQHQKSLLMNPFNELNNHHNQSTNISCLASGELESCVTNNNDIVMDLQSSPIAPQISTMDPHNVEKSTPKSTTPSSKGKKTQVLGPTKEKKKRKRTTTKPSKNKEEVESQRMTHIAVERNRRRQMNEHLNALRSLMPPSYVQRGDQASIIGGAIDLVKELEQVLESLEAQKRMRQYEEEKGEVSGSWRTSSSTTNMFGGNILKVASTSSSIEGEKLNQELRAGNKSALADIQVIVIQNHVNLKIRCQRQAGQLLNAILALEQLSFTVLHLNITSFHSFVYYSFNLKIEEECKLGSADEVATAVHQIFRLINSS